MEIFYIIFHFISFLKDCMAVEFLSIFLIVIFLVINDDGDNDDDRTCILCPWFGFSEDFQEKNLKIYR